MTDSNSEQNPDQTQKKRPLALFDFDGTITIIDTFPLFILYTVPMLRIIIKMPQLTSALGAYVLGKKTNSQAKQAITVALFQGTPVEHFTKECDRFCQRVLPKIVRKQALERIQWHQQHNHDVIIVSASCKTYIQPWAEKHNIERVIATEWEIHNGKLTGRFSTPNCNGHAKVTMIESQMGPLEHLQTYAYGNSKGDLPMLSAVINPYYRRFK